MITNAQEMIKENSVLLVEDDVTALDELHEIVDLEGWTPYTAKSVQAALDILATTPSIGVVVTDVHFHDENGDSANGIQLISRAQAQFPDRNLSFVVLSGDPDAFGSSVQTGAVDFLSKPLNADDLVSAIKAAWQTGGEERSNAELTSFLLDKMQKTAQALKQANQDLEHRYCDAGRTLAGAATQKTKPVNKTDTFGEVSTWVNDDDAGPNAASASEV